MVYTTEDVARVMGCTVEQVKSLHAKNAAQLALMLHEAVMTGKNINGFTAEQLRVMYKAAKERAYGKPER